MKHTPGPWKINFVEPKKILIYTKDSLRIATCYTYNKPYWNSSMQCASNAQLISSAPDLLEALQELVHLHMCEQEGMCSGLPSADQWYKAIEKASKAIEKATV